MSYETAFTLQESLPTGMRVHSIGTGHAKVKFPGYYSAVLTLAEAPVTQAEHVSQPWGQIQQEHPQPETGHPQATPRPASHSQQGSGAIEAMDVDQPAGTTARTDTQTPASKEEEQPHKEKTRWRLLSFEILPSFERAALTPEQQSGLQSELECRMWQAADLRAQCSLEAAQLAQQAQHGADTAQSGPSQQAPESSQQAASARADSGTKAESSQPSSRGQGSDSYASQQGQQGQDPKGAAHPLQVLHNVLAGLAGRVVLHEVHGRLQQMLDKKGRWAGLLKLNAAAVLSNGIRQDFRSVAFVHLHIDFAGICPAA